MSPFYQVVVTPAERFCFVFLYQHWSVNYRSFLHKVFSIGTKRRIVNKKSALISRLVLFEDHSGLQVKTEHKPGHVMQFPTSNAKKPGDKSFRLAVEKPVPSEFCRGASEHYNVWPRNWSVNVWVGKGSLKGNNPPAFQSEIFKERIIQSELFLTLDINGKTPELPKPGERQSRLHYAQATFLLFSLKCSQWLMIIPGHNTRNAWRILLKSLETETLCC